MVCSKIVHSYLHFYYSIKETLKIIFQRILKDLCDKEREAQRSKRIIGKASKTLLYVSRNLGPSPY